MRAFTLPTHRPVPVTLDHGYCALARGFGERRALAGMALLFVPLCIGVGRGEGAASVLIVGMYLAFATALVFAFSFAYRVYRAAVFRRID